MSELAGTLHGSIRDLPVRRLLGERVRAIQAVKTLGPDFDRRQAELDDLVARMDALADECLTKSERMVAVPESSKHCVREETLCPGQTQQTVSKPHIAPSVSCSQR